MNKIRKDHHFVRLLEILLQVYQPGPSTCLRAGQSELTPATLAMIAAAAIHKTTTSLRPVEWNKEFKPFSDREGVFAI